MADSEMDKSVLENTDRREKFVRLLGGKKSKNIKASEEWMKHVRSAEDELALEKGLETQYNTSMTQAIEGKTKRHEGIGYEASHEIVDVNKDDVARKAQPTSVSSDNSKEIKKFSSSTRSRSRSPIRKLDQPNEVNNSSLSKTDAQCVHISTHTPAVDSTTNATAIKSKKQFYMQFKKASS